MAGSHSSSRVIAERYVNAVFEFAGGDKTALKNFESFFADLEAALEGSDELARMIADPTASRKTKTDAMRDIAGALKAGKEQGNFLELLAKNNRLDTIASIISVFRERLAAERGEIVLEITTAHALDKKTLSSLQDALAKETGKPAVLKTNEDPSILGGAKIKLGSTLLDCSVAGKLARLEQSLQRHIANA